MADYLAIDMGGTFIKYSIINENYEILEDGSTPSEREPEEFLAQLFEIGDTYKSRIDGIAICMAGMINPVTGENKDFSVGPRFRFYNFKEELERRYQLPVLLENDSNCAALGEMMKGAGRGCSDFCMITFGTGIGGAIIINGELYRGRNFKAGELGLTRVGLRQEENDLVAEEAGATAVLARKVSNLLEQEVDGKYIFEHMDNLEIAAIYSDWLYKGAMVVGNLAATIDPEKILIGGGISESAKFISDIKEAIQKFYPHFLDYTEIKACEQGNAAGRIGALYLLIQSKKRQQEEKQG